VSEGPFIWLDGERASSLPLPDRGFSFGDGLFETLLVKHGAPLFVDYHLERMRCGLDMLGIPCQADLPGQIRAIASSLPGRVSPWASLRVTVSRGEGPRGYRPPQDCTTRVVIEASALEHDADHMQAPATVDVAALRLSHQPLLAGLKHLNRLEQVLAAQEAARNQVDELLMLDTQQALVSVVAGNLFLRRDGQLFTPPIKTCGVAGTRRRLIVENWAGACGLPVNEKNLSLDDIDHADELFYSNSLVTVRAIGRVQARTFSDHSAAEALFEQCWRELQ